MEQSPSVRKASMSVSVEAEYFAKVSATFGFNVSSESQATQELETWEAHKTINEQQIPVDQVRVDYVLADVMSIGENRFWIVPTGTPNSLILSPEETPFEAFENGFIDLTRSLGYQLNWYTADPDGHYPPFDSYDTTEPSSS